MKRAGLAWLVFSLLAGAPRAAMAEAPKAEPQSGQSNEQRAAELKKRGDELFDAGKHAEAYGVYSEAYGLSADPVLLYNEGRTLQAMGEYPAALDKFEQFARLASPELRARVAGLDDLIADMRSRVATLVVKCNVEGARILVRDKHVGNVRGQTSVPVRAGGATVELLADGYEPFRKDIDLRGGAATVVEATLLEKNSVGVLSVRARPEGSVVYVDNKPYGPVPVEARLAPGTHGLVVRHSGFVEANTAVTLAPGEHRGVDLTLETPPPITAKWWFWTGVGVVVAGGAVLSYALLTEKSASSGTFSPGQVRGP